MATRNRPGYWCAKFARAWESFLGGGFYWLVPAALPGIVGAVYNARVLLVEIVR